MRSQLNERSSFGNIRSMCFEAWCELDRAKDWGAGGGKGGGSEGGQVARCLMFSRRYRVVVVSTG